MFDMVIGKFAAGMAEGFGYEKLHALAAQLSQRDLLTATVGLAGNGQLVGTVSSHRDKITVKRGLTEALSSVGLTRPVPGSSPLYCPDLPAHAGLFPQSSLLKTLVADGMKRALICPLLIEKRSIGWLYVLGYDERSIDSTEADAWKTIAALLSVAAERDHLLSSQQAAQRAVDYPDNFDQAVRQHILQVLKKSGGRIYGWQGAADRLGIKPSTLQGKMKKLGMQRGEIFKTPG